MPILVVRDERGNAMPLGTSGRGTLEPFPPQGQILPSTTGEETLAGNIGAFKAGTTPYRPGSPEESRLPIPRQILMTPTQRAGIAAPGVGAAGGEGTAYRMLVGAQGGPGTLQAPVGTPPPAIMAQQVAPAGPTVTPPPPVTGAPMGGAGVAPAPTPATTAPAPAGQPSTIGAGKAAGPSTAPSSTQVGGVLKTGGKWWDSGASGAPAGGPAAPGGTPGTPGTDSPSVSFGDPTGAVRNNIGGIPSGGAAPDLFGQYGALGGHKSTAEFQGPGATGGVNLNSAQASLEKGMAAMAKGDYAAAMAAFDAADKAAGGSLEGGVGGTGGGGGPESSSDRRGGE